MVVYRCISQRKICNKLGKSYNSVSFEISCDICDKIDEIEEFLDNIDNSETTNNSLQSEIQLLRDIINFKCLSKKYKNWDEFVDFVYLHSEKIINWDMALKIINGLHESGGLVFLNTKHEYKSNTLYVNDEFCSKINIDIPLIKNEFEKIFLEPIGDIINQWIKRSDHKINNKVLLDLKKCLEEYLELLWVYLIDDRIISKPIEVLCSGEKTFVTIDITNMEFHFNL